MRNLVLAAAAALSLTAIPASLAAQELPGGPESAAVAFTMSAEQKALHDGWSTDRRNGYAAWTPELQQFFWSLSKTEQRGWWVLTPDQRGMVMKMTPENRAKAFASILAQLNAADGRPDAG